MASRLEKKRRTRSRIVVSNLDSVEQGALWHEITRRERVDDESDFTGTIADSLPPEGNLTDYWKDLTESRCRRLLALHPHYANMFAGIVRSAYLNAQNLVIPYNQLLDGIFFLMLGPASINAMLGKSGKNNATLIISGRGEDLERCMRTFFFRTCYLDGDGNVSFEANENSEKAYTLSPKRYSALGFVFTEKDACSQSPEYYRWLTRRIRCFERRQEDICSIVADAFIASIREDASMEDEDVERGFASFGFLAQRWREWISAVDDGIVAYENQMEKRPPYVEQKTEYVRKRRNSASYWIRLYAARSFSTLEKHYPDNDVERYRDLCDESIRSDAFERIDALCPPDPHDGENARQPARTLTNEVLHDWYQYAYQRGLAAYLDADLISVSATKNSFAQLLGHDESQQGRSLIFDGKITDELGAMPDALFAQFCYQHRGAIDSWRRCDAGSTRSEQKQGVRNISYAVDQTTAEHGILDDRKRILVSLAILIVATPLSVTMDYYSDGLPLWIVVGVVCVVNMLPSLFEGLEWFRGVKTSEKTIVYLANE